VVKIVRDQERLVRIRARFAMIRVVKVRVRASMSPSPLVRAMLKTTRRIPR